MKLIEVKGDLFESNYYLLAHCISRDCKMGAGIALEFDARFPAMKEYIRSKQPRVGECVMFDDDDMMVGNLITKERHFNKPTYSDLETSLVDLKGLMEHYSIFHLAIPRIGCGLDGLKWNKVEDIICDVFKDTDVEIKVYSLI